MNGIFSGGPEKKEMVKPHGRLVPVSYTSHDAFTPGLSTRSSSGGLQLSYEKGRSNLRGGLALRCFQRLSFPNIAARQCR